MNKILVCAECGYIIKQDEIYYEIKDNYLRVNYFDDDKDAIFCSPACVMRNISCDEDVFDGSFGDYEYE